MLLAAGDTALGGHARERSTAKNLKCCFKWFSDSPGVCFNPLNCGLCSSRDVSVTFSQQERGGLRATSMHQQHAGPAASTPGGKAAFCGAEIPQAVSGEGRWMRWWSPPEDNVAQEGVSGALPPSDGVTCVADRLVLLLFD